MSISDELKISNKFARKMEQVLSGLDGVVIEMVTTTESSNLFWAKIQIQIRKEYREARKVFPKLSFPTFNTAYNKGVADTLKKVNNSKFTIQSVEKKKTKPIKKKTKLIKKVPINEEKVKIVHTQAKESIIKSANLDYVRALNGGEKDALKLAKLLQDKNKAQKTVDKLIKDAFLNEGTTTSLNAQEIKKLLRNAIDKKYLSIVDAKGKIRRYKTKTYTDMLVRTKLREANTVSVVNTATSVGADLVQVSSHNTKTEFDAQFEGKIYSLSGNDTDFPAATFLPPFHPNCLHVITVVIKESLEQQGTLKEHAEFSSGGVEVHPTRTSHIPISERGF